MKSKILLSVFLLFLAAQSPIAYAASGGSAVRPNVLFILIDDLKPIMKSYGDDKAVTPNLDELAAQATLFTRAYVQYPVCGPSRASMLTGLRPEVSGVMDLKTRMRDVHPDILTLPGFFKRAGYQTAGVGKVFDPRNVDSRADEDPASWSIPYRQSSGIADKMNDPNLAVRSIDAPNAQFIDGQILERGIELLRGMAASDQPFFLAVGFKKPHLPFVAPKKYFDLYDRESFQLADFQQAPAHSDPDYLLGQNGELLSYFPTPPSGNEVTPYEEPVNEAHQRELLHGYYAATSFVDSLVGELLQELDQTGKASDTIVVVWGDHGFHLGDHLKWGKHTTMEQANRIPLLIKVPGIDGGATPALAESLDLFPTLAELAGLEAPTDLQGESLVPVLKDKNATFRPVAISQYKRLGAYGYSMRTDRYRYTEWIESDGTIVYRDLYDMLNDPGETANVAGLKENTALLVHLADQLREYGNGLMRLYEPRLRDVPEGEGS